MPLQLEVGLGQLTGHLPGAGTGLPAGPRLCLKQSARETTGPPLPHHASSLRGGRPTVRGACTFYLLSLSLSLASALSLRPILTAPRGEPGHHLTPHPVNHGLSPLSRKNELDLQSGHGGTHPPRHGPGFAVGTRSAGWGSSQHVCHPCVQAGPTEPGALPPPHLPAPCPPGMPGGAFRG